MLTSLKFSCKLNAIGTECYRSKREWWIKRHTEGHLLALTLKCLLTILVECALQWLWRGDKHKRRARSPRLPSGLHRYLHASHLRINIFSCSVPLNLSATYAVDWSRCFQETETRAAPLIYCGYPSIYRWWSLVVWAWWEDQALGKFLLIDMFHWLYRESAHLNPYYQHSVSTTSEYSQFGISWVRVYSPSEHFLASLSTAACWSFFSGWGKYWYRLSPVWDLIWLLIDLILLPSNWHSLQ